MDSCRNGRTGGTRPTSRGCSRARRFVSRSSESSRVCPCPTFRSYCRRRSAGMTDPARTSPSATPTAQKGTKLRPEGGRSLPCRASTCTHSSPQSRSLRPSTLCDRQTGMSDCPRQTDLWSPNMDGERVSRRAFHAGLTVLATRRPRRRHAGWHVAVAEVQEGRRERIEDV